MSNTVFWGFDEDFTYTQFDLDISIDKGLTYSALTTITFDTSGADFDAQKNLFFFVDATGNPGDIYRITGTGPLGTSDFAYAIAGPAAPSKCVIIGYVMDARGEVDQELEILVTTYAASQGGREDRWVQNPSGVVAQSNKALGVMDATFTVFPNEKGLWQVSLIQRTIARIQIPELKFDWAFEVPEETGPKNIRDILQLRGGSFYGIFPETVGTPDRITRG